MSILFSIHFISLILCFRSIAFTARSYLTHLVSFILLYPENPPSRVLGKSDEDEDEEGEDDYGYASA